jgi:hypothetical protein
MVHATRELEGTDGRGGGSIEDDLARDLNPTWWPFLLVSLGLFALTRVASKLPRSLDYPQS